MSCPETKCGTGPRAAVARAVRTVQDTVQAARVPLLNGALARVGVVLALFPLDVAKTRAQLRTAQWAPRPLSLLKGRGYLLKNQIHVFRGAPVAMIGAAGAGALSYIAFAALNRATPTATASLAPGAAAAAAAAGGGEAAPKQGRAVLRNVLAGEAVAAAWLVPFEGAKIRVQAGIHSSTFRAFRYSLRGPRALYAGWAAHLARDLPARALSVAAIAAAAKIIARVSGKEPTGKWGAVTETAVAGALVGAVTSPLDLVRTRVMAQRTGSGALYSNFLACGRDVIRKEGPLALFRGVAPRTVYMALSAGLFAVGFEAAERTLKEKQWLWYRPDVWVEDDRGKARQKA